MFNVNESSDLLLDDIDNTDNADELDELGDEGKDEEDENLDFGNSGSDE